MNQYVALTIVGLYCFIGGVLNERSFWNDSRAGSLPTHGGTSVLGVEESPTLTPEREGFGHAGRGSPQAHGPEVLKPETDHQDYYLKRWRAPGKRYLKKVR